MKSIVSILCLLILTLFSGCKKKKDEALPSYDDRVVPYKIIEETFTVGAKISFVNNDNKIFRSITLPNRALYWSYWLGVGDEPVNELAKVIIPAAVAKFTKDPFIAYGWNFLSVLNAIKSTGGNVDLYFCDSKNKVLFLNKDPNFTPYEFFQCPQAITSYAIRETMAEPSLHDSTFYAVFKNDNPVSGEKVTFKVWAYVIKD
jgi:hypothetical protein